jgi:hypothetical protein
MSDHRKILKSNVLIVRMLVNMVSRDEKTKKENMFVYFLAVAFGHGCYFARDSLYSHSYAAPDRNGLRRMFLGKLYFIF